MISSRGRLAAACLLSVSALAPTLTVSASSAAPAPVISGRVVDLDGAPIAGITLISNDPSSRTYTAADGTFKVGYSGYTQYLQFDDFDDQTTSSPSHVVLSLGTLDVPAEGLDVGDVDMPRLAEASKLRVQDADGDPIQGATWSGSFCNTRYRPEVPSTYSEGAFQRTCWDADINRTTSNEAGLLRIALPLGLEDQAIEATRVQLRDPATGDPYIENFADATYDATSRTYTLTVVGSDAPARTVPGAPTSLRARGSETIFADWQPPTATENSASVTGYRVEVSGDKGTELSFDNQGYQTFINFPAVVGERYIITVTSLSDLGEGGTATTDALFSKAPGKIRDLTVTVKRHNAYVSWTAPNTYESDFRVEARLSPGGAKRTLADDATSVTFKRLKRGDYTVRIAYRNSAGVSVQAVAFRIR